MPVKDGRSGPQDAAEACRRGSGKAAPRPGDPWLLPKGLLHLHGSAACLGRAVDSSAEITDLSRTFLAPRRQTDASQAAGLELFPLITQSPVSAMGPDPP